MTSRGAEKMNNDTIGVDVSKDHLDAHRLADGATRRFANTKGGHKALIKWLTETPLYRVVFEPTGPYHRAVERALGIAGVPFVKVNPRQARRFAEATGKLAKTDRLDAAILARMGALLELEARPARSELLFELKELYVAREALVKDRRGSPMPASRKRDFYAESRGAIWITRPLSSHLAISPNLAAGCARHRRPACGALTEGLPEWRRPHTPCWRCPPSGERDKGCSPPYRKRAPSAVGACPEAAQVLF